jgi:RNA-binding protein
LKLSSKQIRYLRGLGHHLTPVAMIGQAGITDTVIASIKEVLTAHELIKIKALSSTSKNRHDIADQLKKATGAKVVQILGKTLLLYKENKDRRLDKKLILPD